MSEQRWSDRIGTPQVCQLCGRKGFDVKTRLCCWSDEAEPCMDMATCSADVERCRSIVESTGGKWPDGLVPPKTRLLPALVDGGPA